MARKDEMETLVSKKPPPESTKTTKGASAANNKALITRNLRLAYGEVASEPVPDRLLNILSQMDDAEGKKR